MNAYELAHDAYELAHMADVHSPDSLKSPGARWLVQVASYADKIYEAKVEGDRYWEDRFHEAADSVVPVYTHNRWQVWLDLCAYQEDLSEWGPIDPDDLERGVAGEALYLIAERLLTALVEAKAEEEDSDDDAEDGE